MSPTCAAHSKGPKPPTLERMRAVAASRIHEPSGRGGECLNPEAYKTCTTKLMWRCGAGHEWPASWTNINHGKWCPRCAKKAAPTPADIVAAGLRVGLEYLSEDSEYAGARTKLRWRCQRCGSDVEKSWAGVSRGYGCSHCLHKTEAAVRDLMEFAFGIEFTRRRADWLTGTGPRKHYTLDGLNEEHKLAFEYHGPQHVKNVAYFHGEGRSSLDDQQARDAALRAGCEAAGVTLMEIWPVPAGCSPEEFVEHCRPTIEAVLGEPIPPDRIDAFLARGGSKADLAQMHAYAAARGGNCLATRFIGASTKYSWQCSCGYQWVAPWAVMKYHKSWCTRCAGNLPPSEGEIQAAASAKGGQCLNPEAYVGGTAHLQWRCGQGHEWGASWGNIRSGKWCPKCAGKASPTMAELQAAAAAHIHQGSGHGGVCLNPEAYAGANFKLNWRCGCGYEWAAPWASIQSGRWCHKCAGKAKPTVAELQRAAQAHTDDETKLSGECLNPEAYLTGSTKLRWRGGCGHEWEAPWRIVQQGKWCPLCRGKRSWAVRRANAAAKGCKKGSEEP